MAKLTLKEPPENANAPKKWLQERYTPPQAPTFFENLVYHFKRLARVLLILIVILVAFLALPFRKWDNHDAEQALKRAVENLAAHTDSREALSELYAAAEMCGLTWGQPNGPRPTKRHQFLQRHNYDISYGVIQTLGLGIIKEGNIARGMKELRDLYQRTAFASVPGLPNYACSKCETGINEEPCAACGGEGQITVTQDPSAFPLQETLKDTRKNIVALQKSVIEKKSVRQNCPKCNGTGKMPCAECMNQMVVIKTSEAPRLFSDSLNATLRIFDQSELFRRAVHVMAVVQRTVLGGGQKALYESRNIKGVAQISELLFPSETENTASSVSHPAGAVGASSRKHVVDPVTIKLHKACERVLVDEEYDADLQMLLGEAAHSAGKNPALQNCAMSAFGLSLLLNGKTNEYCRVAEFQKAKFNGTQPLLSIQDGDYLLDCTECDGNGKKLTPCPACTGPNACPACKGTGKTKVGEGLVPCEDCRNRPPCTMCKDTKKVMAVCPECRGAKKIFKVGDKIKSAYMSALSNMLALCAAEIASAPEGGLAEGQTKPADGLAESAGAATAANADTTDVYAGEDHGASPSVPLSGTGGKMRYVLILAGVVAVALLFVGLRRKTSKPRGSTLPGMQRLNPSEFTDPLKLTAQDSRDRRAKSQSHTTDVPQQ